MDEVITREDLIAMGYYRSDIELVDAVTNVISTVRTLVTAAGLDFNEMMETHDGWYILDNPEALEAVQTTELSEILEYVLKLSEEESKAIEEKWLESIRKKYARGKGTCPM